jgi:hypothetical protein
MTRPKRKSRTGTHNKPSPQVHFEDEAQDQNAGDVGEGKVESPSPGATPNLGFRFSQTQRNDPTPEKILEEDWSDAYGDYSMWTDWWEHVHEPQGEWPPKV